MSDTENKSDSVKVKIKNYKSPQKGSSKKGVSANTLEAQKVTKGAFANAFAAVVPPGSYIYIYIIIYIQVLIV